MIHVSGGVVPWLLSRNVRYTDAVSAQWYLFDYGTAAVRANGLITYELAETYDEHGVTGFDVRVQNALV